MLFKLAQLCKTPERRLRLSSTVWRLPLHGGVAAPETMFYVLEYLFYGGTHCLDGQGEGYTTFLLRWRAEYFNNLMFDSCLHVILLTAYAGALGCAFPVQCGGCLWTPFSMGTALLCTAIRPFLPHFLLWGIFTSQVCPLHMNSVKYWKCC